MAVPQTGNISGIEQSSCEPVNSSCDSCFINAGYAGHLSECVAVIQIHRHKGLVPARENIDSCPQQVDAVGVNVIGDHEDICNARLVFENGCVANITASRLAMKTERKLRVFSRQAYLSLDYFKKDGIIIQAAPNVDLMKWIKEHQKDPEFDFSQANWAEMLHIEPLDIEDAEPLLVEQQSFLKAVAQNDARPEVTAQEGLNAMECAEMILEKLKEHKWD